MTIIRYIDFYDFYRLTVDEDVYFYKDPVIPKPSGCRRFKIEIEIPEPEVDGTIQAKVIPE